MLSWLHDEWTQQGRFARAAGAPRLVDETMKVVKPNDDPGLPEIREARAAVKPPSL